LISAFLRRVRLTRNLTMRRDAERVKRIQQALADERLDAVAVAAPNNVLLLSGYWPVVGTGFAVATRGGKVGLVIPEDESNLASRGWADEVRTFKPASLDSLINFSDVVRDALKGLTAALGVEHGCVIGYQRDPLFIPSSYVSINTYGASIRDFLNNAIRGCTLRPASEMLSGLRCVLTPEEVDRVRLACNIAKSAFEQGVSQIRSGLEEWEVAELFHPGLFEGTGEERRGGQTFCMSGPNSARAARAYQLTRHRKIQKGDFVLVHCNSYADGYWTDITRTFCVGKPDEKKAALYRAVLAASRAAIEAVRPGVKACDVDASAREVMRAAGFGTAFVHATGHGVGFAAIDHNALPRIHPKSDDVLEPGAVFNIEPAAYFEGEGGIRHCDVVTVTETGAELLTPFLSSIEELTIPA
jgi:Xaa-Pro aminopeptidase